MVQPVLPIDRTKLSRVMAVINGKGGVGKTTTTANLGGFFALNSYRTLAIDLDPQGNLEDELGYADNDDNDKGASLAKGLMFGEAVTPISNVRPNLDVWAGGNYLAHSAASLTAELAKSPARSKLALARLLEQVAGEYDMILIDCPPGDGPLQQAALGAARWVLVPTKSDESSIKGLYKVTERFDEVLDVNPGLDLLGIVLFGVGTAATRKDGELVRKSAEKGARTRISEIFGTEDGVIFEHTIRHSETVASQVRRLGLLAYELDERGKAEAKEGVTWWKIRRGDIAKRELSSKTAGSVADDLQGLAQEIIDRIAAAETEGAEENEGALV